MAEILQFFLAALHAVAPNLSRSEVAPSLSQLHSGEEVWDWCVDNSPIARTLAAGLSVYEQAMVTRVLEGMLRERDEV